MANKYDLLGKYNDLIKQGNDPYTAISKLSITNGVTKNDLLELDKTFLGGTMNNVINTIPTSSSNNNYSSLFGPTMPSPFNGNPNSNNNGFNPFDF